MNLKEIFLEEYQYSLKQIKYQTIETVSPDTTIQLKCVDALDVIDVDKGVEIVFTRSIEFTPKCMYNLSVSFNAVLFYKDGQNTIDKQSFKEEILKDDNAYLSNIVSRASLLISEITSSYGQNPAITPPVFYTEN